MINRRVIIGNTREERIVVHNNKWFPFHINCNGSVHIRNNRWFNNHNRPENWYLRFEQLCIVLVNGSHDKLNSKVLWRGNNIFLKNEMHFYVLWCSLWSYSFNQRPWHIYHSHKASYVVFFYQFLLISVFIHWPFEIIYQHVFFVWN